jgi:hypothetical protein
LIKSIFEEGPLQIGLSSISVAEDLQQQMLLQFFLKFLGRLIAEGLSA